MWLFFGSQISFSKGATTFLKISFSKGAATLSYDHFNKLTLACNQFPKRKFLLDDRASFLDLKPILILLIASFLIEINAKYSEKVSDKNFAKSKFGLYFDGCSS